MDLIGQTLGQYQIIEAIGRGGMAAVYKGYQPALERFVAIKVLAPQHAQSAEFAERFVREAKAVAALDHPNILPIIDFGQRNDINYIVMKYVSGGTLADRLKQPIDLLTTARLIKQVAAALDHAHNRGILHRDVKPSNVLLDANEWAQLTDFGLAKILVGDVQLTDSGMSLGTPAYISPEQGEGAALDRHTDIYSLGVILFEMTTGRLPFTAETPLGVVVKHIYDAPPAPRSIKPDLPVSLENVILKALAKPIGERYHTAGELAAALEAAVMQLPAHEILTTHLEDPNATPKLGPTPIRVTPATPISRKQLMEETAPHVPHFIGREDELAYYQARLERDHFVVVTGLAGMGKTTLGAKLARSVADSPDNIFWFTFDQVEKSTADALYWALASFLDSRGEPNLWTYLQGEIGAQKPLERMAKLNLLMNSLASGQHVLCFDDFQIAAHLPDIAYIFKTIRQRFVDLHQPLPARIILMGREVSPDMEYLASSPLTGLSEVETAQFFKDRKLNLPDVLIQKLWERTEGNPKLLELSVSALAGRQDVTQQNFVVSLARKGDIRDYVMNNIYTALTGEEQAVMGALSVFTGTIEREGAEDILAAEGITNIAQRLDGLINKHVITEIDDEHLHLHSLVREYCYHVANRKDRDRFHQRAADYFEAQRNWLPAAHHHFERKLYGRALDLLADHSSSIINAGGVASLLEQLTRFQRETLSGEQRVTLDKTKGDCHRLRGEYQAAIQAYEAAFNTTSDGSTQAELRRLISNTCLKSGDYQQALVHATRSLELAEAASSPISIARAQHEMAAALYYMEDLDQASERLNASEKLATALKERQLLADIYLGMGLIDWKRGQFDSARVLFETSRRLYHELDDQRREAYALNNLGLIMGEMGHRQQQQVYYQRAYDLHQKVHDIDFECMIINNLAYAALVDGDTPKAIKLYQRLGQLGQATGNFELQVIAGVGLADGFRLQGDLSGALEHAQLAQQIAQQLPAGAILGLSNRALGEVWLDLNQLPMARYAFENSVKLLQNTHLQADLAKAQQGLAAIQAQDSSTTTL